MGSTLQLRLPVPLTTGGVRRLCARVRRQLSTGTVAAVVCSVDGGGADLATVDALARLALVARRAGVPFALDHPAAGLSSLLAVVGLRRTLAGLPDDR
jgi:hypothetical protein